MPFLKGGEGDLGEEGNVGDAEQDGGDVEGGETEDGEGISFQR